MDIAILGFLGLIMVGSIVLIAVGPERGLLATMVLTAILPILLPFVVDAQDNWNRLHWYGAAGYAVGGLSTLFALCARNMVGRCSFHRHPTPVDGPMVALVIVAVLCAMYGFLRGNSPFFVVGQLYSILELALFFFLAGSIVRSQRMANSLTFFTGVAVAVVDIVLLFIVLPGNLGLTTNRHRVIEGVAFFSLVYLAICWAHYLTARNNRIRKWNLLGAGVFALTVLLSYTRSYWAGASISLLYITAAVMRQRKSTVLRVLVAGGLFLAVVLTAGMWVPLERVGASLGARLELNFLFEDPSIKTRLSEAHAALNLFKQNMWLGIGLGGQYGALRYVDMGLAIYNEQNYIHNAYLFVLLKMGLLGSIVFAWFYYRLLKTALKRTSSALRSPSGQAVTIGLAGFFFGLTFINLTSPEIFNFAFTPLIGFVLAILATPEDATSV